MHRILLTFVMTLAYQASFSETGIEISNAWINEAPPTVRVLAGYLKIINNSEDTVVLTGSESSEFGRIEFHLTEVHDGVAKMQKQEEIIIAAGSEFSFIPGEYHLMLFDPVAPVKNGDQVPLSFSFSNGDTIRTTAVVKRGDNMPHHH